MRTWCCVRVADIHHHKAARGEALHVVPRPLSSRVTMTGQLEYHQNNVPLPRLALSYFHGRARDALYPRALSCGPCTHACEVAVHTWTTRTSHRPWSCREWWNGAREDDMGVVGCAGRGVVGVYGGEANPSTAPAPQRTYRGPALLAILAFEPTRWHGP